MRNSYLIALCAMLLSTLLLFQNCAGSKPFAEESSTSYSSDSSPPLDNVSESGKSVCEIDAKWASSSDRINDDFSLDGNCSGHSTVCNSDFKLTPLSSTDLFNVVVKRANTASSTCLTSGSHTCTVAASSDLAQINFDCDNGLWKRSFKAATSSSAVNIRPYQSSSTVSCDGISKSSASFPLGMCVTTWNMPTAYMSLVNRACTQGGGQLLSANCSKTNVVGYCIPGGSGQIGDTVTFFKSPQYTTQKALDLCKSEGGQFFLY